MDYPPSEDLAAEILRWHLDCTHYGLSDQTLVNFYHFWDVLGILLDFGYY